jgi:hypothetical protein
MTSESPKLDNNTLATEISFKEILLNFIKWGKYVFSKWLVILAVALTGGLISFLHANNQKLNYIAVCTFVLQEPSINAVPDNNFASLMGFDVPAAGGLFQGDNLLELYRTRFMIKKALLSEIPDGSDEYLVDRYLKVNGLKQAWDKNPKYKNFDFVKSSGKQHARVKDSLITLFANDIRNNYLSISKDRLNIFRVEVKSKNEEFSKLLNEQLVQTVNLYYIQNKTKRSLDNLRLLQRQTDSIRAALNGAMYRVASTSDFTINLNPARQVLRVPSQRNQVDAETNRAMLNELVRNLEFAKLSLRKETPLIQLMDEPVLPLEKRRPSRAKAIIIGTLLGGVLAVTFYSLSLLVRKILE